jgi:hypothetical protein
MMALLVNAKTVESLYAQIRKLFDTATEPPECVLLEFNFSLNLFETFRL